MARITSSIKKRLINSNNSNHIRSDGGRLGSSYDVNVGYEGSQSDAYSKVKSLSETEISNIKDQDTRSLVRNLQASLRSADENWNSFVSSQAKEKAISDVATLTQTNTLMYLMIILNVLQIMYIKL